jgi:hypothetical protein
MSLDKVLYQFYQLGPPPAGTPPSYQQGPPPAGTPPSYQQGPPPAGTPPGSAMKARRDDIGAALGPIVSAKSVSPDGEPVDPAIAADRVLQVLRDARRAPTAEQEPLGVVVNADLELVGLRGKPVELSWSMWQMGGDVRLHGDWLNSNLAYRLEAATDSDTVSIDLWVPLPSQPGPYFVEVDLIAKSARLASARSEPFG